LLSGGLRYAATTGYYLIALQAEIHSLRFTHTRAAHGSVTQRASQIKLTLYRNEFFLTTDKQSAKVTPPLVPRR
jgi:hypothetical protein